MCNWLQNTKHVTFPERPLLCRLRQALLMGTGEEECEMSKAQTPARSAPDARLYGDVAAHGSACPASPARAAGTVGSGGGLESAAAQGEGTGGAGEEAVGVCGEAAAVALLVLVSSRPPWDTRRGLGAPLTWGEESRAMTPPEPQTPCPWQAPSEHRALHAVARQGGSDGPGGGWRGPIWGAEG